MPDTFHPFPNLPTEIRIQIWALVAGPRNLQISCSSSGKRADPGTTFAYASPNPPPAVMHACREARQNAPYQKAFLTFSNAETKYIWVNFQEDMICLPDNELAPLAPHYADIERLKLTAEAGVETFSFYEYFKDCSSSIFKPFSALNVLHIAVQDCFLAWADAFQGSGYANCPSQNVRFLELQTGLLLTGSQLVLASEWWLWNGGKVEDIDDLEPSCLDLDECADIG
ncbi:hypothetical protein F5B22DRAFT_374812 [Xylaria bambusicola]|uniref:uncharacterized protein n=1 Tax=Xylaria bambusicola TaxID=326684 RepID=UPI0020076EA0|nr:uncharacterized protein F5B22DRAFT_374812 [Xylaria bambusicola]KAI0508950.1 hypothetical protein F5B22DRAFT_374812 [Xylaria bambusicola]